jgi:serine/threonine protein kinase
MATHNQHIIHRDVKPANFLYDITTGDAVLCDYGLAQKIGGDEWFEWKSDCLHSLPGPSWGGLDGRARSTRKLEKTYGGTPGLCAGLHGVKLAKPVSLYEQATAMEREWAQEMDSLEERDDAGDPISEEEWKRLDAMKPWTMPPGWRPDIKGRMHDRQAFLKSWRSALDVAKQKGKQRPGVLKDDRRCVPSLHSFSLPLLTVLSLQTKRSCEPCRYEGFPCAGSPAQMSRSDRLCVDPSPFPSFTVLIPPSNPTSP